MFKNIILIVLLVALVVVVYHFIFESQRGANVDPPEKLTEVLPDDLKQAYLAKQEAEVRPSPTPEAVAPEEALVATLRGNGIDRLDVKVVNQSAQAMSYKLGIGGIFRAGGNAVMLVEPLNEEIEAGATREFRLQTVPIRLDNRAAEAPFRKVEGGSEVLQPLVEALSEGQVDDVKALGTAAILLNSDPTLAEIAAFPALDEDAQSRSGTPESARRGAAELIEALLFLERRGVDTSGLEVAGDPQLKLEAMVKPETNRMAREFYGIEDRRRHWNYWRSTLLEGDTRLRHYALYGIGRFFPEVAIEMMPEWARNRKIIPIYRLSAVYALGLTGNPGALERLEALAVQYPERTNMGRATREAARYIRNKS